MTRYTDEWLDAKLANLQRWKREEAARSAAKQSTAGAASPAGVPSTSVAATAPINATKADAGDRRSGTPAPNREVAPAVRIRAPDAASSGTYKYRNKPTDGYASKREARRAAALRLMQEAGQIQGLREQVEFLLIPRQTRPDGTAERSCSYWADFTYDEWTAGGWRRVVEDVKGMRTREYVLKRKLMLMVHGVAIREV